MSNVVAITYQGNVEGAREFGRVLAGAAGAADVVEAIERQKSAHQAQLEQVEAERSSERRTFESQRETWVAHELDLRHQLEICTAALAERNTEFRAQHDAIVSLTLGRDEARVKVAALEQELAIARAQRDENLSLARETGEQLVAARAKGTEPATDSSRTPSPIAWIAGVEQVVAGCGEWVLVARDANGSYTHKVDHGELRDFRPAGAFKARMTNTYRFGGSTKGELWVRAVTTGSLVTVTEPPKPAPPSVLPVLCETPDCDHSARRHDEDGCMVENCPCAAFSSAAVSS